MSILSSFGRKRLVYQFKNAIHRLDKKPKHDKIEERILSILTKALSYEETELLQEQSMLYIHWRHITIKISVMEDRAVIMNGKYYYYLFLSSDAAYKMRQRFYKKVNKRLCSIENKFNNNIIKNLENVLTEMDVNNETTRL